MFIILATEVSSLMAGPKFEGLDPVTPDTRKVIFFMHLRLNEADALKSSSIVIYYPSCLGLQTQSDWQDAVVIKSV
jgi:hypothetical protein